MAHFLRFQSMNYLLICLLFFNTYKQPYHLFNLIHYLIQNSPSYLIHSLIEVYFHLVSFMLQFMVFFIFKQLVSTIVVKTFFFINFNRYLFIVNVSIKLKVISHCDLILLKTSFEVLFYEENRCFYRYLIHLNYPFWQVAFS